MNKILYSKFDKTKIGDLPRAVFPGRIITILSPGEAQRAVDYLLQSDILGFDTETRPVFKKGARNKVALLQVSTHNTCFLFRLNRIGLCPAVKQLLEAEGPLKIGLSWHDDIMGLHKRGNFEPKGFIDLQDHMTELGIKDMSLAKLYANLFRKRISKREQLSNWEADVLSQKQKEYAATDAWACIMLYEEYMRLKETQDFFLEYVPEPEPQQPAAHKELEEQADGADNVEEKKPAAKRTARKTTTRRKATSADGEPKTTRKRSTAKASTKTSAKDTTAKAVAAKAKAKDTTAKAKAPAKRRTAKKNNVELQLTGDNPQMAVEIENTIQNV